MKKQYYTYAATDLSYQDYRKAVNFAISVARNPDLCREASLRRERVALKLFDPPDASLLERLTTLGFKED